MDSIGIKGVGNNRPEGLERWFVHEAFDKF